MPAFIVAIINRPIRIRRFACAPNMVDKILIAINEQQQQQQHKQSVNGICTYLYVHTNKQNLC